MSEVKNTKKDAMHGIEYEIYQLLCEKSYTITTAESCSGGLIAATLVNVPGISQWFLEGHVTYSNAAKEKYLGVSHDTLESYGAVSEQTAREMALGGVKYADADVCIAVTGIAGPDGGTDEKPVGLVYIACAIHNQVVVERHVFDGDRKDVRNQTAEEALRLVKQCLEKKVD